MHSLISRLFEKRKIVDLQSLSNEENETFRKWDAILSTEEVTPDSIKKFCLQQREFIERQWDNLDNSERKNERLILQHTMYSKLLSVIDAPQKEREQLESYLQSLIDAP